MNGIGGTRVVGQKFVANTNGQTFLDDSGSVINVLENSNQPSKQCPIVDSIEINGENSTITVALVNKNNTSANLVFSNCNQDASDVSTDICSIIACN
jgi:hypothetical protein